MGDSNRFIAIILHRCCQMQLRRSFGNSRIAPDMHAKRFYPHCIGSDQMHRSENTHWLWAFAKTTFVWTAATYPGQGVWIFAGWSARTANKLGLLLSIIRSVRSMVNVVLPPACAPAFLPFTHTVANELTPSNHKEITLVFFFSHHRKCFVIPGIAMAVAVQKTTVAFIGIPVVGHAHFLLACCREWRRSCRLLPLGWYRWLWNTRAVKR